MLESTQTGDLHQQHMLFSAMLDSWPKLQKAINEIARKVSCAPWKVIPFAERGEKPTPEAEAMAKKVEALTWGMKPRAEWLEHGLEETIEFLVRGYFSGHAVQLIEWDKTPEGAMTPRCTKHVPARYYGYPSGLGDNDQTDRLMFDRTGMTGARAYEDFQPGRFLIAIHCGHSAHPAVSAPSRALVSYWLAAIYGLKWFMGYTQIYGIPWRHAKVGDEKDIPAVSAAMLKSGTAGYVITKGTAEIDVVSSSASGATLPQRELIALADQQCDQFILGQTLTGGTDNSGSRSLGEVHQGTLDGVIDGIVDFVGGILTHQLIPAIVAANWGDGMTEMPSIWGKREEKEDVKRKAERMEIINRIGVPMTTAYVYEELGIPIPAAGDELFGASAPEPVSEPPQEGPPPEKEVNAGLAEEKLSEMAEHLKEGKTLDWQALAVLMAAGFVDGSKPT
jgi:phage gp29-like protein